MNPCLEHYKNLSPLHLIPRHTKTKTGSVSVNMMKDTSDRAGSSSINSKTTTSPPAAMPRFYDSDTEEGAGSLGTS